MASKTVQMIFVALSAIGVIGVIICCALPEWLVGHDSNTELHVGLWKTCVKHRAGHQWCVTYDDSMMQITSEMKAFRALIVISCMLGILGLLLLFFGSDFTTCVQNQDTKPKMILAAGVGLILAGLLVIIPVSWLTHNMRNAPEGMMGIMGMIGMRGTMGMMLGASIYIGFLAGLMLMLIGGLLCYLSRSRSSSSGGTASFSSNRV